MKNLGINMKEIFNSTSFGPDEYSRQMSMSCHVDIHKRPSGCEITCGKI
jgi:hypothetical protein